VRDKVTSDEIELATNESLLRATERQRRTITVGCYSGFNLEEGLFSTELAIQLMEIPLRIVLENRYSDGAFLKFMLPEPLREKFERALDRHWLELEQGGGIEEIKKRVENLHPENVEYSRVYVVFDRDAIFPGNPSEISSEICQICEKKSIPYHRLERRAIENYFPKDALRQWAFGNDSSEKRRKLFSAFLKMSDAQRSFYNFKNGLSKDRNRDEWEELSVSDLYDDLDYAIINILEDGFGSKIALQVYDSPGVDVAGGKLADEPTHEEMKSLCADILFYL
jgi:hypothetical protein